MGSALLIKRGCSKTMDSHLLSDYTIIHSYQAQTLDYQTSHRHSHYNLIHYITSNLDTPAHPEAQERLATFSPPSALLYLPFKSQLLPSSSATSPRDLAPLILPHKRKNTRALARRARCYPDSDAIDNISSCADMCDVAKSKYGPRVAVNEHA
jgi:hypothetical protein